MLDEARKAVDASLYSPGRPAHIGQAESADHIFTISKIALDKGGFADKVRALDSSGAWKLIEKTEPFRTIPFSDEYADLRHWICVYRKSA